MRNGALRRAVGASVVLSAAALLLGNGVVGTTFALFNGETSNPNSAFAGGWVDTPSAATAAASGYDVSLTWTAGTHGPVTGQQLNGIDNGTNSNCTGAAYSLITGSLTASTTAYTDASRGTAGSNGDWFCYQLVSTSATVWTAPLALPAVQLGLVATGVTIANAGTANTIEKNDTITITFNQRTNLTTASVKVCPFTTGVMLIGDTSNGANCGAATDPYTIAKLTLSGSTITTNLNFKSSTVALSTSAPWTATITLAGVNTTAAMTGSPTWTLTGSSSVLSNATVHQATLCSASASTCQPTTTTNF